MDISSQSLRASAKQSQLLQCIIGILPVVNCKRQRSINETAAAYGLAVTEGKVIAIYVSLPLLQAFPPSLRGAERRSNLKKTPAINDRNFSTCPLSHSHALRGNA